MSPARLLLAGAAVAAAAALAGCGNGGDGADSAGPPASAARGPAADSADAGSDPRPLVEYRLLVTNESGVPVVVRADAGAGAVTVDTVAAGASSGTTLRTRADSVALTAEDTAGASLDRVSLRLDPAARDSVLEWRVRR